MSALMRYDEACRAVAVAKEIDEVKEIRDKAEAVRAYARQAKNRSLEIDAAEIRIRAERRLGEMLKLLKLQGKFSGATRTVPGKKSQKRQEYYDRLRAKRGHVTCEELGIDRLLSQGAQRLADIGEESFEKSIEKWRSESAKADGSGRVKLPLNEVRKFHAVAWEERNRRELAAKTVNGHASDALRGIDGRKYSEIRFGELHLLRRMGIRQALVVEGILGHVAHAEQHLPLSEVVNLETLNEIVETAEQLSGTAIRLVSVLKDKSR
jgi:hypothetical protein